MHTRRSIDVHVLQISCFQHCLLSSMFAKWRRWKKDVQSKNGKHFFPVEVSSFFSGRSVQKAQLVSSVFVSFSPNSTEQARRKATMYSSAATSTSLHTSFYCLFRPFVFSLAASLSLSLSHGIFQSQNMYTDINKLVLFWPLSHSHSRRIACENSICFRCSLLSFRFGCHHKPNVKLCIVWYKYT